MNAAGRDPKWMPKYAPRIYIPAGRAKNKKKNAPIDVRKIARADLS